MREIVLRRRSVLRLAAVAVALAAGEAVRARPLRRKYLAIVRPTVALDAGHGGNDPGAIAPDGVYEKTITLAAARVLARQLSLTRRYRVVMTRYRDEFVPLAGRVARARAQHADVFLSLHADALPEAAMRGASVFTLSAEASDREAAMLAKSENDGELIGLGLPREPREVGNVLLDLARRENANRSIVLAHKVLDALQRQVVLLDHPLRSAGFVVLGAPDIPSVLVELGCLSNPGEEHLLQQPRYQRRLAEALVRGVENYFAFRAAV
ncbi:MAG TPA: N-acetylmuramoyl-L-alanine amidase [Stellaceae bacterium]|nr:N-acetylmuramoyl-L-alanine amidase [Stellaceae bacterium]